MPTSPSALNYSVLKGKCFFTPPGGQERDLGNAPEVELTPEVEKLDHFSSRAGVRKKDRSVPLEQTLRLRVVLDEITAENLALALAGGEIDDNTAGRRQFGIFALSEVPGSFRFEGTNDVGSKVFLTLPKVSFMPSGSIPMISEEWAQIEIEGEVLFDEDAGDFGTCEIEEAEEVTA